MDLVHHSRLLQKLVVPHNFVFWGLLVAAISSCSALYILSNVIAYDADIRRTHPLDLQIVDIFSVARSIVWYVASAYAVVSIILLFCWLSLRLFPNIYLAKFNRWVKAAYNNKVRNPERARLVYLLTIGVLFCALFLPLVSYLLTSVWPLWPERPVMSSADKRWMIATYNFTWVVILVAIPVGNAILKFFYCDEFVVDSSRSSLFFNKNLSYLRIFASILLAGLAAFLAFGPPWNIELLVRPINTHLAESMSSYQAIETGSVPYIGAASFGYGPGTQMITYLYQVASGGLSVDSLRQSYAFLSMASAFVLFSFVLLFFRVGYALPVFFFTFLFSPLIFYQLQPNGVLNGLFGWSNPSRYLALPLVTLFVVRLVTFERRTTGIDFQAVAMGLLWGVLAYVSQENGAITLLAVMCLLSVSIAGGLATIERAGEILLSLFLGLMIVGVPIALYYALHGGLWEFVANYRLMPSYALVGVTGSYPRGLTLHSYFYFVPVVALIVGTFSYLRIAPLRLSDGLSSNALFFFAVSLVLLLAHMSGIVRTANTQVINSTIGTPFFFASLCAVPVLFERGKLVAGSLSLLIAVSLIFAFLPADRYPQEVFPRIFDYRMESFATAERFSNPDRESLPVRLPDTIVGLDECCHSPIGISGGELESMVTVLRREIGDREVHVDSLPGINQKGMVVYLSGLNVASTYREMNSRYPTSRSRILYSNELLDSIADVETLVTTDLESRLAASYLEGNPSATISRHDSKKGEYFIINRSP